MMRFPLSGTPWKYCLNHIWIKPGFAQHGVGDQVIPNEKDFRPFEYKGKPLFVGEITMMFIQWNLFYRKT